MNNGKKRFIHGTNPKWGRELPDGYDNSLVDKAGNNYDNGWNFDEKDDDDIVTYDSLAEEVKFDPNVAKKAKEEDRPDKE